MQTTAGSRSAASSQLKTEQEPPPLTEELFTADMREQDEELEGIQLSGLMLSHCRLTFAVAFGCAPKRAATERTLLSIAPRAGDAGRLTFSFRYHPTTREKG